MKTFRILKTMKFEINTAAQMINTSKLHASLIKSTVRVTPVAKVLELVSTDIIHLL
jgi:hypothetical protein